MLDLCAGSCGGSSSIASVSRCVSPKSFDTWSCKSETHVLFNLKTAVFQIFPVVFLHFESNKLIAGSFSRSEVLLLTSLESLLWPGGGWAIL